MPLSPIYRGESLYEEFEITDEEGTPVPHSEIDELKVIYIINKTPVAKFIKTGGGAGWETLTQEADPGVYSLVLTEAMTLDFPQGILLREVWVKITGVPEYGSEGLKLVSQEEIRQAITSYYSQTL